MKKSKYFLFLFFILLTITIISRQESLFMVTFMVYVVHILTLTRELKEKQGLTSTKVEHVQVYKKKEVKNNTPETKLARNVLIAMALPFFIVTGVFVAVSVETNEPIFAFIAMGIFLVFFIIITVTVVIIKSQTARFEDLDTTTEKSISTDYRSTYTGHDEHDAFIQDYSNDEKDCYEEELKEKKKKKRFNPFREHEWDDEDDPIDC